ncbi:hypothetical protein LXA43DRAFT_1020714 [Ganoderma leucocontextum]|nr:hypothetical protein LXA43DRAFT_1020714 [Ganoderma leucocontextum]
MPHDTGDHSADAQRVLSGETTEYVVTHPGRSQYSQTGGGVSACGLAALNCARIVLGLHSTGLDTAHLVQELMKRKFLEDILQPCLSWSSPSHLAVDEICKVPIFRKCLEMVSSDYGQAGLPYFERLISNIAAYTTSHSASTCVIITRPPEIIACFCLADVPAELFVIFDSHPRPEKHPHGAAFIFKNSIRSTAEYLTELLHYDEHLLSDSTVQWQAQLLAHCSGDIFVARPNGLTSSQWAELALDSSLEVLKLQARVRSLEKDNENLESDKQRLGDEVSRLDDKVLELDDELVRLKAKHERLRNSNQRNAGSSTRTLTSTRSQVPQSPLGTPSTRTDASVRKPPSNRRPAQNEPTSHTSDFHSADALAIQMQRAFDEENRKLKREIKRLKDIQPGCFDCGVCFERHQDDHLARVMPCGHSYCRPCLREYAVSKIKEHRFPVLCPSCLADKDRSEQGELDDFAIQQLGLDEKQYEIFNEMQMARFSTIIHCRKCLNTIFVDKKEYQEAQEIVCPLRGCGYAWCKLCSHAIQIGGPKHSCDGSSELNDLMHRRGWKHCPGCQTPAEKIDGCNHMTCASPGCNAHFCYLCGQLIVRSMVRNEIKNAVSRHYRRCTLF